VGGETCAQVDRVDADGRLHQPSLGLSRPPGRKMQMGSGSPEAAVTGKVCDVYLNTVMGAAGRTDQPGRLGDSIAGGKVTWVIWPFGSSLRTVQTCRHGVHK